MQSSKLIYGAVSVVILGLGTIILQASCSRANVEKKAENQDLEFMVENKNAIEQPEKPSLPPEIEALNSIQRELSLLSDENLEKEEARLNNEIRQNNLLEKMNNKTALEHEQEYGKKILVRMALIRVEKGKRSHNAKKS